MKCPRCQHENLSDSAFCDECGARLEAACPACGEANRSGAKFCRKCGQALSGAVVASPATTKFASPESYTPKHLAERIVNSKAALEGERKQVTVLFADLKGSMELLANRDPEEARKILDPVLERMMEAVHHYEGTVNQVMGDGIMALFGAPLAHEDHAVRACYAALRMQESVKRYAEEVHRTAGVPLHIRVGVNSGEVIVRSIGSDLHMDYTAVGQTTHLAARMEQMAMPGSILIAPETLQLAEGYVLVKPLGERPVKGLQVPIEVFEVVGAGTVRSRLQAAAARGLTKFVGRDAELNQLRQAMEQAGTGHGQVVAVVGDPGVGKSRLFWEFTHSRHTHGWLTIESSSVSYGKATAFLPLIELLRTYFQIEARDATRKIREKVTGRLFSLDRALEPSLSALLWLLDVPVDDPQWQRMDPPQRRLQTLDGIKRLLLRESQVQPLLLVFEDLHWIDAETQALLDSVVESLPTARLLVLVNYRPEYQHGWGGKTSYRQLRIDPLPPESAEELLEVLLGNDVGLRPLKRLLIERTEGNPFFLEESVRTLVETKALAGERGVYHLVREFHDLQIPATAQAILAARIDRLAPEDKRLLQTASVIGKDVPFTLLQTVAEGSEESVRRGLRNLQAAEFLYEARLFPDLDYTFKHALTHEVAYGSVLQDRRRALHGRIVDAIEALYPERLTEQVDRLAHHAVRGERWEKAVIYLRQAGAKAFARSTNREAVAYFEQGLKALTHLPETRERLEGAIDVRIDLRNSLVALGELGRMIDCLREAEALATTLGDQRRLGWVATFMANCLWHLGDHEHAVEAGRRALAIATVLEDLPLRAEANFRLGQAYHPLGDYGRAIEFLRASVEDVPGALKYERLAGSGLLSVFSRTWLAWCLAELGEFEEGIARGEEAVEIARLVDHPYTLVHADFGVGLVHLRRGNLTEALAVLEHGLELCRAATLPGPFPVVAAQLGLAYALSGRIAKALPLLSEVAERTASMKLGWGNSPWVAWVGEAYLLAGHLADATPLAGRTLEVSRERGERGQQSWALWLLAEIASRHEPPQVQEAGDGYGSALALGQEIGMRPLVAHCHLGLGTLYRRTDKREQAQERLTTATTMYREMGMTYWLEKAQRELEKL
jgi:class 3 adenylate cyclase/tetratricopeptide (TPR) repeat protein